MANPQAVSGKSTEGKRILGQKNAIADLGDEPVYSRYYLTVSHS
ncbi:MAG: hypothetical protein AAF921_04525 [Cyanobacteria bacterium P01_D01_bin.44]